MAKFIICALLFLVITGCGNDKRILERLSFAHTLAYDLLPNNQLRVTLLTSKAEQDNNEPTEVLSTIANNSKEARIHLSRQTNRILVSGQVRNTLFSRELAQKGLANYIDTLVRDPSISPRVKLTIVNGNSYDLISKDFPQHPRTGPYIDRMLEKEAEEHSIPSVSLHEFFRDYRDDAVDPVVPIVHAEKEHVHLDGIALFRDDKYATKLEPELSTMFAFLQGKIKNGELNLELSNDDGKKEIIMLGSLVGHRKVRVKSENKKQLSAQIDVKLKASVLEYIGGAKISNPKERKELEAKISKHISQQVEKIIHRMQQHKVDSIGVGKYVRNSMSYQAWKQLNWREVYPKVSITCKVHLVIKDYGKFE